LDDLLKDFIKNNNLPKPRLVKTTSKGKMITWQNGSRFNQVILYSEIKNDGSMMQMCLGGPGKYKFEEVKYCMEGSLKGKKIDLEAEISETQNYEKKDNPVRCFAPSYEPKGEPEVRKNRIDKEKYWFVTEPRIQIKTKHF
jgi:hypothetical protein